MGAFTATKITQANATRFVGLMPPEIMEEVAVAKSLAFGMLKKDGRKKLLTPVSACVYYTEPSRVEDTAILRVKWLYVHEKFRNKGVGDAMMQQLMDLMRDNAITSATIDYCSNEDEEAMDGLLEKWGFDTSKGMLPECIVLPRDMAKIAKIERFSYRARPLSSVSANEAHQLVERFLSQAGYRGYLNSRSLPEDYIELSCSCFIGNSFGRTKALLLSHRTPNGRIRVEYLHSLTGRVRDIRYLLCTFAAQVHRECQPDTEIEFPIRTVELRSDLDKLFPNQMTGEQIEGVLLL